MVFLQQTKTDSELLLGTSSPKIVFYESTRIRFSIKYTETILPDFSGKRNLEANIVVSDARDLSKKNVAIVSEVKLTTEVNSSPVSVMVPFSVETGH